MSNDNDDVVPDVLHENVEATLSASGMPSLGRNFMDNERIVRLEDMFSNLKQTQQDQFEMIMDQLASLSRKGDVQKNKEDPEEAAARKKQLLLAELDKEERRIAEKRRSILMEGLPIEVKKKVYTPTSVATNISSSPVSVAPSFFSDPTPSSISSSLSGINNSTSTNLDTDDELDFVFPSSSHEAKQSGEAPLNSTSNDSLPVSNDLVDNKDDSGFSQGITLDEYTQDMSMYADGSYRTSFDSFDEGSSDHHASDYSDGEAATVSGGDSFHEDENYDSYDYD